MPFGLGGDFPHVHLAAQRLLGVGRSSTALRLLGLYAREDASAPSAELIAQGLDAILATDSSDPELAALTQHDFETLFELLDNHADTIGWERIARLQWAYLPVLGLDPKVHALHKLLSSDPAFFVDVLSKVYRSKSGVDEETESPERARLATNGYRLLSSWATVPGLRADGTVDGEALRTWVHETLAKLDEIGRREVGEIHIGNVLAWSPPDADGHWPTPEVRDLLEELQNERVEQGVTTQMLNRRGVTTRSPEQGGAQERDLVAKYTREADRFADQWPRTAAILRALASSYEHDARREEHSAERFRRGLVR
jgi:hypothetical protein